jgi:hypothetical protein
LAKVGDRECALYLAHASDCGPDVLSMAEMRSVTKLFEEARLQGIAPAEQGIGGWHHKVEATTAPRTADLPGAKGKVRAKGRSAKPARPAPAPVARIDRPRAAPMATSGSAEDLATSAGGKLRVTSLCEWIEGPDQASGKSLERSGFTWSKKRSSWWREIPGYQRPAKSA